MAGLAAATTPIAVLYPLEGGGHWPKVTDFVTCKMAAVTNGQLLATSIGARYGASAGLAEMHAVELLVLHDRLSVSIDQRS